MISFLDLRRFKLPGSRPPPITWDKGGVKFVSCCILTTVNLKQLLEAYHSKP